MPKVIFIEPNGTQHTISVEFGRTVMEAAARHVIPGIDADCGGARTCATCHVYVDESWVAKAGVPGPEEADMLEFAEDPRPESRLSCQIRMTDDLDGLIVRIPVSQN